MRDIDEILDEMELEQKTGLLAGKSYWKTNPARDFGIPSLNVSDGPHGLRKLEGDNDHFGEGESVPATCFPTAAALACSFDTALVRELGVALGEECRKEHVAVILGPGANIKRHPLGGRNFEYFSEDPLLSGKLASAYVKGVQSQGVGTSLKHFAANSQERERMVSDSVIDDRALNEIYLRPFEICVRESQPWTVMAAYNKVNGLHATENPMLLTQKLRDEWGFEGAAVSDWGAMHDPAKSVRAGLDLVMPGPNEDYSNSIAKAVSKGALDPDYVDLALCNVLSVVARHQAGQMLPFVCVAEEHLELARHIAEESAVLLENDGTLPLDEGSRVAIIGAFAKQPRYQGAGSSRVNPSRLDCAWDAFCDKNVVLTYADGYDADTGEASDESIAEAVSQAKASDVAVVFVGLPASRESEGFDRTDMQLPEGHNRLVERVCAANPKTVVVVSCGAPVELPWRKRVSAILLTYLPGCQGGTATANLLMGEVSPSGKLAETWPERLEDTALSSSFPERTRRVLYRESVYVGYRYYDAANVEPAYPFGYGLSYTQFEYLDFEVTPAGDGFDLSCTVRNAGTCYGAEVVQFYVGALDSSAFMPKRQLVAFKKTLLAPGKKSKVTAHIGAEAFRWWDPQESRWRVDEGRYKICCSASSRDERIAQTIDLRIGAVPFEVSERAYSDEIEQQQLESYYEVTPHGFSDEEFALLYGRELPKEAPLRPFTIDSTFADLKKSRTGKLVWRRLISKAAKAVGKRDSQTKAFIESMSDELPLRSLSMKGVPASVVDDILSLVNHEKFKIAGRKKRS